MTPLSLNSRQVNGVAGQEPLPVPQDQPSGAGGGTMAETVPRLRQQVSLSEQVMQSPLQVTMSHTIMKLLTIKPLFQKKKKKVESN